MRLIFLTFVTAITAFASIAQEAVYVIRHVEKELSGDDPAITAGGKARAAAWAKMLEYAGLDAVFTSDAKRTQQTGEVIAEKLGVPMNALSRNDIAGLIDALVFDYEDDSVLVVGHAETIPVILESLGAFEEINVSQTDFANLFVLIQPGSEETRLIRVRMP